MKRNAFVIIFVLLFLCGCGGGGGDGFVFTPVYPEKLESFADDLNARAHLISSGGSSVLSGYADGELEGGTWRFEMDSSYGGARSDAALRIEFTYAHDGVDFILATVDVPLPAEGGGNLSDPGADAYDFGSDFDSDGLSNIDEFLFGVDPMLPDSDGDGVPDGTDVFPSASADWADTDNDGIGDNSDDDIDGDGIPNGDEYLIGTDPFSFDTDDDGVPDGDDVCPLARDPDQDDFDSDGRGDFCDGDSDGDGLSDSRESALGTDPLDVDTDDDGLGDGREAALGSDPLKYDTDADGRGDKADNCPLDANGDQSDIDRDGYGDACDGDMDGDGASNSADNCPSVFNADQSDEDTDSVGDECDVDADGDGVPNDSDNCPFVSNPAQEDADGDQDGTPGACDLDDSDAGVADARSGVFVDIAHGSNSSPGTIKAPKASIGAAIAAASSGGMPVYVAAGIYDASDLSIAYDARIYGGFRNGDDHSVRFSERDVRNQGPSYRTVITRNDIPTTLFLSGRDIVVNGFHIQNEASEFDAAGPSATIDVISGVASIEKNTVSGNALSYDSVGVLVRGGEVALRGNMMRGGSFDAPGSRSMGVIMNGGSVIAINNIILAGWGRFATGVSIENSSPALIHNTIDARSGSGIAGVSRGISFIDSSPIVTNNIVFTGNAPDQYPLTCWGLGPSGDASFQNNLLADFNGDSPPSLAVDCDGIAYEGGDFAMGDAVVASNIAFGGAGPSDLVDGLYIPVGGGGPGDGVDDGLDIDREKYADAVCDFYGKARPVGGADIGAVER